MPELSSPRLPEGYELIQDRSILPQEILELRGEQVTEEEISVWQKCLLQSLHVLAVRDNESHQLVGIGMLAGNQRHAELVDGTVHPDVREQGIGAFLMRQMVDFALKEDIRYISLTFDEDQPWLQEAYGKFGFKPIDFCMWHEKSLK